MPCTDLLLTKLVSLSSHFPGSHWYLWCPRRIFSKYIIGLFYDQLPFIICPWLRVPVSVLFDGSFSVFIFYFMFFEDFIYLFLERGEGREKERERNISVWLSLVCPRTRVLACNPGRCSGRELTSDLLFCILVFVPLNNISQGSLFF